jgi:uncharacterized protein with HEPN domain
MSAKTQDAYLYDMLESAQAIQKYTSGVTADQFWDNPEKRDAVAMRIAAISDAAGQVTAATASKIPEIPFRNIRGMRNRIAHEYGSVNFREVWKVVDHDIKPLIAALENYFSKQRTGAASSNAPKNRG